MKFKICICTLIVLTIYLTSILVSMYRYGLTSSGKDGEYTSEELTLAIKVLNDNYNSTLTLSNSEYKKLLEKEFNLKFYIYREKELKNMSGSTNLIFRIINIDENSTGIEYGVTLAHEMVHLKWYVANERFVNAKTFELLHKSENKYLKNLAYYLGLGILNDKYETKYICKRKIIDTIFM